MTITRGPRGAKHEPYPIIALRKKRVTDWVGSWELDRNTRKRWIRYFRMGGTICTDGDRKAAAPCMAGLCNVSSDWGKPRCSRGVGLSMTFSTLRHHFPRISAALPTDRQLNFFHIRSETQHTGRPKSRLSMKLVPKSDRMWMSLFHLPRNMWMYTIPHLFKVLT